MNAIQSIFIIAGIQRIVIFLIYYHICKEAIKYDHNQKKIINRNRYRNHREDKTSRHCCQNNCYKYIPKVKD